MDHEHFINLAKLEAQKNRDTEDADVGAVLTKGEELIAQCRNQVQKLNDPIAVAEMQCFRAAGRRGDQNELALYTTRYPDMLVAGTIVQFSLGKLVVALPEQTNTATEFLKSKNVPVKFVS